MSKRTLRVSVALTTRNRADHALACVKTILANEGLDQLFVIDQSDGDQTEAAIATLDDARLRFIRTESRGVTKGRNLGAELAQGDVIAFTDDDCRVAPDWIPALTRIFANDPEVAVVCGRVRVAEAVKDLGFTEKFEPHEREWQGRYPPFGRDWGITANLAVRLDVLARVGKFDPMLGAGAPLRSGGEPDLLFRVLREGFKVVNASEVRVDHLGVRKHGEEFAQADPRLRHRHRRRAFQTHPRGRHRRAQSLPRFCRRQRTARVRELAARQAPRRTRVPAVFPGRRAGLL